MLGNVVVTDYEDHEKMYHTLYYSNLKLSHVLIAECLCGNNICSSCKIIVILMSNFEPN